jgi:enamine deaminase RidA (YjgF/YER057c/UK114 family)
MLTKTRILDRAVLSTFGTPKGVREHSLVVTSDAKGDIFSQLAVITDKYDSALQSAGLSDETHLFTRVYLSDPANQSPIFRQSMLYERLKSGALSVMGQACLNGGAVSLISYHINSSHGAFPKKKCANDVNGRSSRITAMHNYSLLWNAGFSGMGKPDSYAQTQELFETVGSIITDQGMTLLSNSVRSWIYVRDIDNNYKEMVRARREFFTVHDLTENTRYLASTGIEGKSETVNSLVTVDALSIGGLQKNQISRMDALENMPRTIDYGVTFERGLRVQFGDRTHIYISGTASINKHGDVLHVGNVRKQTERTIENIRALISSEGGSLDDLAYLLVYVRDSHDFAAVREVLVSLIDRNLPVLFLYGAVCRPAWLVEMEGVAIISDQNEFPLFG